MFQSIKSIGSLALLLLLISGCRKSDKNNSGFGGNWVFKIKYSLDDQVAPRATTEYHTRFGDYIGSITPTVFKGKFLDMRIQQWSRNPGANTWEENMNLIDNNTPIDSSNRIADFSNNAVVNFYPVKSGQQSSEPYTFNIFVFINLFYFQEFELPEQYDTVGKLLNLDYGGGNNLDFSGWDIGGVRNGRNVKGGSIPMLAPVFDTAWKGFNQGFVNIPKTFVFGETDSAFSFIGKQHVQTLNNPIGQEGIIMRSPHYDPITLNPVPQDSVQVISGTLSFDTDGLIQIYAGKDNKPYTSDDVFVYAPRYWNRIKVNLK